MKKRLCMTFLALVIILSSLSITAINALPNKDAVIENSLTKIEKIPQFKAYQTKSVAKLNQETLDLSEFQLSNINRNTLEITNSNKKYLEFALIAKQFIDDIKVNTERFSEHQLVEIRDKFYTLVDELKLVAVEIYQINTFNEEEKNILSDIYIELFTQETVLKDAFPLDDNREFKKTAELTKQFIVTEYHSIERLTSKGLSFIQKIDDIIEKVENGTLSPQQGSNEIDKIWIEWKNL